MKYGRRKGAKLARDSFSVGTGPQESAAVALEGVVLFSIGSLRSDPLIGSVLRFCAAGTSALVVFSDVAGGGSGGNCAWHVIG